MNTSETERLAEITFSTQAEALKAIEEFNATIILKNRVKVLKGQASGKIEFDKEYVGNLVYPIALKKFSFNAPKLTGMICDAILELKDEPAMLKIIQSEQTLNELVILRKKFFFLLF